MDASGIAVPIAGTRKRRGERDVLRASRRVAKPPGRAGTRAERIPGPVTVGQISRVFVRHAPAAKRGRDPGSDDRDRDRGASCSDVGLCRDAAERDRRDALAHVAQEPDPASIGAMARLKASTIAITGPREPMRAGEPDRDARC